MKTLSIRLVLAISLLSALTITAIVQSQTSKAVTPAPSTSSVPTTATNTSIPNTGATMSASPVTSGQPTTNTSSSSSGEKTANIFHSKYVTVAKTSYRQGEFSDSITGTIVNSGTIEVTSVDVSAALLDKDNNLINVASGSVDFSSLKPGEDSSFRVDISSSLKSTVDHYMLFVEATPK